MILLPHPVSANRYWRTFRNRVVRSAEANAYKTLVSEIVFKDGFSPLEGFVELRMTYHPRTTKKGTASRVRLDLDNCIKVALDALIGIAYADDRQVVRLLAEIGAPTPDSGLTMTIGPWKESADGCAAERGANGR